MTNIIAKFKNTPRRTYAPKGLFREAVAVLKVYWDLSGPEDREIVLARAKMREKNLIWLIYDEPEGMVQFTRLERAVRLVEIFEELLQE